MTTILTIDLDTWPPSGDKQVIIRMMPLDKHDIEKAARALHMSEAQFVRCAAVLGARQVLEMFGDKASTDPVDRRSVPLDPNRAPGT